MVVFHHMILFQGLVWLQKLATYWIKPDYKEK